MELRLLKSIVIMICWCVLSAQPLLDYDQLNLLVLNHFQPIKFRTIGLRIHHSCHVLPVLRSKRIRKLPRSLKNRKLHKNNFNSSPPPAPQDAVSLEAWWNQSKHLSFHSFFKTARASFHTRRWLSWWLYCDWKSEWKSEGKLKNSKISICRLHLINRN